MWRGELSRSAMEQWAQRGKVRPRCRRAAVRPEVRLGSGWGAAEIWPRFGRDLAEMRPRCGRVAEVWLRHAARIGPGYGQGV